MSELKDKEWVLPASIPFSELKRKDLEECVYWLLDAMGAKDLEWRTGGGGDGAADGGRDLEAHFFVPNAEGEIICQKWWIECKGCKKTVEPDKVKSAANNSLAYDELDYLIIATNTQFSNPTRDWIKKWQNKHPKPKIELWDQAQLERYLSRHPDVVLRLFSNALSIEGRFHAMQSRFWNKLEYVTLRMLKDLWKVRTDIDVSHEGIIAVIVNEFANGSIIHRPWASNLHPRLLLEVLLMGLINVPPLIMRASKSGIDAKPIYRAFAYLILTALDILPAENVTKFIQNTLLKEWENKYPEDVQELFLMPIVYQLLQEIQDVCSSDCIRISLLDRNTLTNNNDEVKNYWLRLERDGIAEDTESPIIRLEKVDAPCAVGFPVDKDKWCPLFQINPTIKTIGDFLIIIKRVAAFRKAEASEKRQATMQSGK